MPKRGEIVVERLTGRRAIVIHVNGPEEVTCRFADGRLEDRFTFELEPMPSLMEAIAAFLLWPFTTRGRDTPAAAVQGRVRPMIVRQGL
jgi:hypothetical protein